MNDKPSIVDRLLATWTAGRIVALLTPILFVPLAGFITLQAGKYGIDLNDQQSIDAILKVALFAIGGLIAWAKSSQWQKGWREWELKELDKLPAPVVEQIELVVDKVTEPTVDEEYEKALLNDSNQA